MTDPNDLFVATMAAAGFVPPELPAERPKPEALEAADRLSRSWTSSRAGTLHIGSSDHLHETCRMFRETFNPYRPAVIKWPKLSPDMLQRLTSLPIWDIAVHTEGRARLRFASYAATLQMPELRDAVMLNAWEENRHKEVLSHLVKAYGISLGPEPAYRVPRDPEWMYLVTGYSECIDSFFAFGLFELARRSGFFPAELVETFEPVIQEECRHILLFANLVAWQRASLPWWRRIAFECSRHGGLGLHRLGTAGPGAQHEDERHGHRPGQQLHRHHRPRRYAGRDRVARSHGPLPGGERSPLCRVRCAIGAAQDGPGPGAGLPLPHAALAEEGVYRETVR